MQYLDVAIPYLRDVESGGFRAATALFHLGYQSHSRVTIILLTRRLLALMPLGLARVIRKLKHSIQFDSSAALHTVKLRKIASNPVFPGVRPLAGAPDFAARIASHSQAWQRLTMVRIIHVGMLSIRSWRIKLSDQHRLEPQTRNDTVRRTTRSCLLFIAITGAALMTVARAEDSSQVLYLASIKDKTVVGYQIDAKTGKLAKQFSLALPGNGGPLAFSPDRKLIYAAMTGLEDNKAGVATLERQADGSLKMQGFEHLTSRAPYIRVSNDGQTLLAAHYGAGDVTTYRIKNGQFTGKLLDHVTTAKTAHCIELDPSGRFVFVPHTSPNKVYQFVLDAKSGKLTPNNPPHVDGPDEDHLYHQPRHYAHHPKLHLAYTSNERGGGITAYKFDSKNGTLSKLQTLNTLPPGYEGGSAAADIKVTPDGRFAYVSNRDVAKREDGKPRDTLCAVALDEKTGLMKIVGHYPTVWFPRSICIDLSGQFLYAAGQRSANLDAFRIDQETGALTKIGTYETGDGPIWVMCGRN